MMARVGRLAGALLAETGGDHYLVGHPKVPCDWRAAGFEPPGEVDARIQPVIRLRRLAGREVAPLAPPLLTIEIEGEPLGRLLAERFVIARTGSVSERLWRLVVGDRSEDDGDEEAGGGGADPSGAAHGAPPGIVPARWIGELPAAIWQIVRDTVLRCT
ncbi:MAG TPA: hypothetical protein VFT22_01210 [Kofleriaceae bacterium]|nr:hypothetical protein [Kofleriaceae bacterium]